MTGILLVTVLLLPKKRRATLLTLALCLLFMASAFFHCDTRLLAPKRTLSEFTGTETVVMLTVLEVRYEYDYATSYLVEVERIADERPKAKALLTYEYDPSLAVGDVLSGVVAIEDIESYATHTNTYLADGIMLSLTPTDKPLMVSGHRNEEDLFSWLEGVNRSLSARLTDVISGEEGALISSLLLGNRELLTGQTLRNFRRAGIVHMLAISGMHLSLMVLLTEFLLRRLYVPRSIRCLLILTAALFYLCLTGLSLSTVRAFIMIAFVYLGYLLRGDNDPITSLFFALFLILTLSPEAIFDAGMWLSFSATFGILVAVELFRPVTKWLYGHISSKRLCKLVNATLSAVTVSFAASFSVFLPAWIFFDEISLLSIPATLLLSPLVTLALYLAPFLLLFSGVPPIASALSLVIRLLCKALLVGSASFADLPDLTVSLRYPFEAVLIPAASLLLGILLILPLRRKSLVPLCALGATLAFFVCLGVQHQQGKDGLWTSYVRQGDSEMLLLVNSESTVMCDLSGGTYSAPYEAYLLSKDFFSTQIDAYVLTHYHNRHPASLRRLAEQTLIRELFLPFPQNETEYFSMLTLIELGERCGFSVTVYDRGDCVPLEADLTLYISEEIYLKRSTHPTGYVAVAAEGELLVYLGESVHESAPLRPELDDLIAKADAVVLGVHGPVTKTPLPYSFEDTPTLAIADGSLLSYLTPTVMPSGDWVVDCERLSFRHKK